MTALVLDAGALLAVERGDRPFAALLRVAERRGWELRTHPLVVAQAWRDPARQVPLARFLRGVEVRPIDDAAGRRAGILLGRARASDPVDAAVADLAEVGDRIATSDPGDLATLLAAAGVTAVIVPV